MGVEREIGVAQKQKERRLSKPRLSPFKNEKSGNRSFPTLRTAIIVVLYRIPIIEILKHHSYSMTSGIPPSKVHNILRFCRPEPFRLRDSPSCLNKSENDMSYLDLPAFMVIVALSLRDLLLHR